MRQKFYITTPIYYANDVPHIGHTGTTIFADIVARYKRALGFDVFFLTGTDEHGEKVFKAAEKAEKDPQAFVDELGLKWQEYWKTLNITNDQFMKTTMDGHKKVVFELLQKLKDKGDIYKGIYSGMYCVGCEEFKAEKDLVDGKCPEHRPDQIEYKKEENYFFKFSKYIPEVKRLIESGEFPVGPENKKAEMLARINEGVRDMSASRQNVKWGIPIPWDNSQTTYVWVEALMNYYSATKIWHKEEFWPADVHFLGKGNNWFHTVVWPALLLALELPLPRRVYVHGYYNVEGRKMGKSLGNVISPQDLLDRYGVDGTRYLLAASMPYSEDSDVSFSWFNDKYNSDLANGFGNLVSRVAKLLEGSSLEINPDHLRFDYVIEKNPDVKNAYEDFKLHEVISMVKGSISWTNEFLSKEEPWKKESAQKKEILEKAVRHILEIAVLLNPVIPVVSAKVVETFTASSIRPSEALFERV